MRPRALSALHTYTRVPDSFELASLCRWDLNSQCDTKANLYPPVICRISIVGYIGTSRMPSNDRDPPRRVRL